MGAGNDWHAHPVPNNPAGPQFSGGQTDTEGGAPTPARPCLLGGALRRRQEQVPASRDLPAPSRAPLPARRRASSGRGRRRRAARSCRPGRAGARRRHHPSPGTGPGAGGPPCRPGRAARRRCACGGSRCCGGGRGSEGTPRGRKGGGCCSRGPRSKGGAARQLAGLLLPAPSLAGRVQRSPAGSHRLHTAQRHQLGGRVREDEDPAAGTQLRPLPHRAVRAVGSPGGTLLCCFRVTPSGSVTSRAGACSVTGAVVDRTLGIRGCPGLASGHMDGPEWGPGDPTSASASTCCRAR